MEDKLLELMYPIGKFEAPKEYDEMILEEWIQDIENLPENLRLIIIGLEDDQLDSTYRPDGWTIRQVVHHLTDSHINFYVRLKLALTEDEPIIKPYDEKKWAELKDNWMAPVELALNLLEVIHERIAVLLRSLNEDEFKRKYNHPEMGIVEIRRALGNYAWHGRHHLEHIKNKIKSEGWE
jgi:hypothetical protein